MRNKNILSLLLLLMNVILCKEVQGINPSNVNKVLDQLYKQAGNNLIIKPEIKITKSKDMVAAYYRKSNTIVVEQALLDVCKQFGKDSLSALAFVMGHEFIHALQHYDRGSDGLTNYLAWASNTPTTKAIEQDADIGGVFLAYTAGFRTVKVVPDIIDRIYTFYGLDENQLKKYPSKEARKNTAKLVLKQVEDMIHLYEATSLLGAAGNYEDAVSGLEYILTYYKSKEIYNNLGGQYALMALNVGGTNTLKYIYPIELDFRTRLRKPLADRGDESLTKNEKMIKRKYLEKAKGYLKIALDMDMDYYPALNNYLCVLTLLGEQKLSIREYEKKDVKNRMTIFKPASKTQLESIYLSMALAYIEDGNNAKAIGLWTELIKTGNSSSKYQADFNLKILKNQTCDIPIVTSCIPHTINTNMVIDNIRLLRYEGKNKLKHNGTSTDAEITVDELDSSTLITFKRNGMTTMVLQKVNSSVPFAIKKEMEANLSQMVQSNEGFIIACEKDNTALRIDEGKGQIVQWVKFLKRG